MDGPQRVTPDPPVLAVMSFPCVSPRAPHAPLPPKACLGRGGGTKDREKKGSEQDDLVLAHVCHGVYAPSTAPICEHKELLPQPGDGLSRASVSLCVVQRAAGGE